MRLYHGLVISAALLVLSFGAMDVLHGGWDAVAGGLMLVSAMGSTFSFAVLVGKADGTRGALDRGRRSG